MGHVGFFLACLVAGIVGGIVGVSVYHRREAARIRELLARLDELAGEAPPEPGGPAGEPAPGAGGSEAPGDTSLSHVTADVLAGRTTHVEELLQRSDVRGLSLGDQGILQVYRHLGEPLTPSQLARSLNVSLRSLERGLAMALDCTPRQLILAVKMREARRLLESGELNVTGVSVRLAFSSPSHFSRCFRRFYRRNPSDFARRAA